MASCTSYDKRVRTFYIEIGEDDDKELLAHTLMAQTGQIRPGGWFLVWQEIKAINNRTIEVRREFVQIPEHLRHLFTEMKLCLHSTDPM